MAVAYQLTPVTFTNRKSGFVASANATGALAIDLDAGAYDNKIYSMTGSVSSMTITGDATSGGLVVLKFIQDGTGGRTVTWATNVVWTQGSPQQPNAQALSESMFVGIWDGTTNILTI